MKYLLTLLLLFHAAWLPAQSIYSKAFGHPGNPALIFIHGGPGSSSMAFELTTAQRLADSGFYVITYDRRGEGRSAADSAQYNFTQTFADLENLYRQYHLQKATLLAMSFGGIVATRFAVQHPDQVQRLVLISALLNLQETYRTILRRSRAHYMATHDTARLHALDTVEKLDPFSMAFRKACFRNASQNGYFATPQPSAQARALYRQLDSNATYQRISGTQNDRAINTFFETEHYTHINILPDLQRLTAAGMPLYALYGKDDGLYSPAQVAAVAKIAGKGHLQYLEHASHTLFIDRQDAFVPALVTWLQPHHQ